jgi:hypothetical protein
VGPAFWEKTSTLCKKTERIREEIEKGKRRRERDRKKGERQTQTTPLIDNEKIS